MMVRAVWGDIVLAESDHTIVVEGNHYFPSDSVRWEHLAVSGTRTLCPWKGLASYHDLVQGDTVIPDVAWTYRRPLPFARRVKERVAFSPLVDIAASTVDV